VFSVATRMKEAVERIVKSLVGEPDAVEVSESSNGKDVRIEVRVAPGDYGRLIGREGRTIKAIRSVLFMAGQKHGRRFHLDLLED
jgi:uncharacterized protein